jgi:hypothetical protein
MPEQKLRMEGAAELVLGEVVIAPDPPDQDLPLAIHRRPNLGPRDDDESPLVRNYGFSLIIRVTRMAQTGNGDPRCQFVKEPDIQLGRSVPWWSAQMGERAKDIGSESVTRDSNSDRSIHEQEPRFVRAFGFFPRPREGP